jgi:hypothetical protein
MAQTRRMGKRNQRADRPKAPRPPTQASARPSLKSMLTERRGRDVGFAESGFRPTVMGRSRRQISSSTRLLKLTRMGSYRTATERNVAWRRASAAALWRALPVPSTKIVQRGRDVGSATGIAYQFSWKYSQPNAGSGNCGSRCD